MVLARDEVEAVFRREHGLIMAALVRTTGGDFDAAEDALQDAFARALETWPRDGVPLRAAAWLTAVARNAATDRARRERVLEKKLAARPEPEVMAVPESDEVEDDRLRLIFTCCHPAIELESRVALTLRTLGGLTTAEVARAFLVPEAAMAQRLVRVKKKIREAGIPYVVPALDVLAERLEGVLAVVYLIFNEGYAATAGDEHVRRELCAEARRLGELLSEQLPSEPEVLGLLALMTLHDARRAARVDARGELVLLEDQDRSLWDRAGIELGLALLDRAFALRRASGPYVIQAAIAAVHARAARAGDTDWEEIAGLYAELVKRVEGPVVALNHAVAVAMAHGPEAGLERLALLEEDLESYHLFHAARADLLRRLGRREESAVAYRAAIALTANQAERRFLERRLREVTS
ncbi:MAG TPA: sigma-70 family RNA polymerase sigma factor [Planctomycetota bacterium]|nr:sigma-70 family RNA polymerase sigma factor [Planctomycetota bacterium]